MIASQDSVFDLNFTNRPNFIEQSMNTEVYLCIQMFYYVNDDIL